MVYGYKSAPTIQAMLLFKIPEAELFVANRRKVEASLWPGLVFSSILGWGPVEMRALSVVITKMSSQQKRLWRLLVGNTVTAGYETLCITISLKKITSVRLLTDKHSRRVERVILLVHILTRHRKHGLDVAIITCSLLLIFSNTVNTQITWQLVNDKVRACELLRTLLTWLFIWVNC